MTETGFPGGANSLANVRLSQLPEACRLATDAELEAFIADCFGAPHHREVAERELAQRTEKREEHRLLRVWNGGARRDYTYAFRCTCGLVDHGYTTAAYAETAHAEHAEEMGASPQTLAFGSRDDSASPNPLLVDFRRFDGVRALSTTSRSAALYLEALNDPRVENEAAYALDALYEAPYRRRERDEHEVHARKVLRRLAALDAEGVQR